MGSKPKPRTIAVDFDGVLHDYNGWQGGVIQGPRPGALAAVDALCSKGHTVVVFTTRDGGMVREWLKQHSFPALEVTNVKRPFWAIIDDRAVCFTGDWDQTMSELEKFAPYWIKERHAQ